VAELVVLFLGLKADMYPVTSAATTAMMITAAAIAIPALMRFPFTKTKYDIWKVWK
jgi:hypothetical protein